MAREGRGESECFFETLVSRLQTRKRTVTPKPETTLSESRVECRVGAYAVASFLAREDARRLARDSERRSRASLRRSASSLW